MKKLLVVILSLLASYAMAEPAPSPAGEESPVTALYISQTTKLVPTTLHEEDPQLPGTSIDVNYPQLSGENLSANEQQFNRLVTQMVQKNVQQFKNYVKADLPHMKTLPTDTVKENSLQIDYDIDVIRPASNVLISMRLSIEGMQAGRAHPYHTHDVLNYDLNKGKVLALNDLIKPKINFLPVLAKYSHQKLSETLRDQWMLKEGTAPNAKNYALWNLEADGILITFNEYQVGPYSAGVQEVEIPYSQLKNILAVNAVISPCVKDAESCAIG